METADMKNNTVSIAQKDKPITFYKINETQKDCWLNNIPSELQQLKQFCLWRWDWDKKKESWTKVPVRCHDGKYARWKNEAESDLSTLADCVEAIEKLKCDGINFVVSKNDSYTVIDLDDCINDAGKVSNWALDIIEIFNSYEEKSPSVRGIRIIIKGKLPLQGRKKSMDDGGSIEVFDDSKTMSLTGHCTAKDTKIHDRQTELERWHAETFPQAPLMPLQAPPTGAKSLDDPTLIKLAFDAKNGIETQNLFNTMPSDSMD